MGKGFCTFINECCKDSAGHKFIERKDFVILHDNKFIYPPEIPDYVTLGMMIEMSIALQQDSSVPSANKCPQCGDTNSIHISVDKNWVEWQVPLIIEVYY